eukprot:2243250-Pyramimonas_sp.AAC.1
MHCNPTSVTLASRLKLTVPRLASFSAFAFWTSAHLAMACAVWSAWLLGPGALAADDCWAFDWTLNAKLT